MTQNIGLLQEQAIKLFCAEPSKFWGLSVIATNIILTNTKVFALYILKTIDTSTQFLTICQGNLKPFPWCIFKSSLCKSNICSERCCFLEEEENNRLIYFYFFQNIHSFFFALQGQKGKLIILRSSLYTTSIGLWGISHLLQLFFLHSWYSCFFSSSRLAF